MKRKQQVCFPALIAANEGRQFLDRDWPAIIDGPEICDVKADQLQYRPPQRQTTLSSIIGYRARISHQGCPGLDLRRAKLPRLPSIVVLTGP